MGAATLLEDSPRQRGWCRSSCGPALPESLPSLRPEPGPSALEPAAGGRRVEGGGWRAEGGAVLWPLAGAAGPREGRLQSLRPGFTRLIY